MISPAYSESSAISCPTHLVTCLHLCSLDMVNTSNQTDHPILKYFVEPNCTVRSTLVAEQVAVWFTSKCQKMMTISSCILVSTRVWTTTLLRSKPWLQDPRMMKKKLIGPRLVRRLGGVLGALARRELHMPDLAKPEGYKLILVFLEKKGYKKDALDKRLLAHRRYEAIARRPGQTLQDFSATENMAYADAVKAGVGIYPDRRAYHMFIKSGLTDDQINHLHGFVHDPQAEGPLASLDPRKIQEAVLRFCDEPWDVDRHGHSRASMGRYSRPLMEHEATRHRHQTSYHPRSRAGNKGSYTQEPWEESTFPTEDGYECNDWKNLGNSTQPKKSMTGKRKLTWKPSSLESLTGSTGTTLDSFVEKSAVLTRACTKPI